MDGSLHKGFLRLIAVTEVVGGILGIVVSAGGLMPGSSSSGVIMSLLFLVLYALLVFAGVGLWRLRPGGGVLSVALQLAQVVHLALPRFAFLFFGGLGLIVGFGTDGLSASPFWGARFRLAITHGWGTASEAHPWSVSLNLVALACAVYLAAMLHRLGTPDDAEPGSRSE